MSKKLRVSIKPGDNGPFVQTLLTVTGVRAKQLGIYIPNHYKCDGLKYGPRDVEIVKAIKTRLGMRPTAHIGEAFANEIRLTLGQLREIRRACAGKSVVLAALAGYDASDGTAGHERR
ncbi:MAG: hypothetical protein Q7S66_03565 [bacterium]|nr:hypothetical protein [bacterium]